MSTPRRHHRLSRTDREASAAQRPDDAEMPPVECHDRTRRITLSKNDERCVRDADLLVGVPIDDSRRSRQILCIHRRKIPGASGEFPHRGQFRVDTSTGGKKVVEFGDHIGRDDQRLRRTLDDRPDIVVPWFVQVEKCQQRAGVDDQRRPNPSSSSSVRSAIGAPPAKRPPRGRGRDDPTSLLMASLITTASDTPRRRALVRSAAFSSSGRYTVVLFTDVWYHGWHPMWGRQISSRIEFFLAPPPRDELRWIRREPGFRRLGGSAGRPAQVDAVLEGAPGKV